jgi:hypothetical protein
MVTQLLPLDAPILDHLRVCGMFNDGKRAWPIVGVTIICSIRSGLISRGASCLDAQSLLSGTTHQRGAEVRRNMSDRQTFRLREADTSTHFDARIRLTEGEFFHPATYNAHGQETRLFSLRISDLLLTRVLEHFEHFPKAEFRGGVVFVRRQVRSILRSPSHGDPAERAGPRRPGARAVGSSA